MRKVYAFITTEKQIHYYSFRHNYHTSNVISMYRYDEGEKYRLSCGTGASNTKTPYSERRTLVTILEEKLQVKKW
jgi:diaminopimelate epimerase